MTERVSAALPRGRATFWPMLDSAIRRLGDAMLACSSLCLIALFLLSTLDVMGSQFFGIAVPSAFEFHEVLMGIAVFGSLAAIQRRRAHIVVDVFSQNFRPTVRKLSELAGLLAAIAVFAMLTWEAWRLALRSLDIFELSPGYVAFPLYPIKLFVFAACLIALLEFVRQLVRRILFWDADDHLAAREAGR
jgi:TRAP-type C4-dicarboxylate transport system permease small subunit